MVDPAAGSAGFACVVKGKPTNIPYNSLFKTFDLMCQSRMSRHVTGAAARQSHRALAGQHFNVMEDGNFDPIRAITEPRIATPHKPDRKGNIQPVRLTLKPTARAARIATSE